MDWRYQGEPKTPSTSGPHCLPPLGDRSREETEYPGRERGGGLGLKSGGGAGSPCPGQLRLLPAELLACQL